MIWQEIVKTALLGTERSHLPNSTLQQLEALGVDIDEEETTVLLQAAAIFHQQQKVAAPLNDFCGELPQRVADESLKVCSVRSAHHLQLILNQSFEGVLDEFIFHLNENQKQLPPELLPDLLTASIKDEKLFQQLQPALGQRGTWLIQQNPEWQKLVVNDDPNTWLTGRIHERFALIRYLRKTAPELAITLLESTWKQESLSDKLTFLKLLPIGLNNNDESFLEQQLDNGRKEVRTAAAKLLIHLPKSGMVGRMYQRVEECLYFQSQKLIIELPEEVSEEEKRDGIQVSATMYTGGMKASHFGQLLASVPPELWEIYLNKTTAESLQLFLRTDWRTTVLPALIRASVRFNNTNWAKAIIQYWLKTEEQEVWRQPIIKELILLLPTESFNQICMDYIDMQSDLIAEESAVAKLLLANVHSWENRLTIAVVKGFQNWLNSTDNYFWNTWHYRELLQIAACRADVNLFEPLKTGWRFSTVGQLRWEKEIEQMLRTLLFRREMIQELKK